MLPEFVQFPKIPRWSRDIVITEKIDGCNGLIYVDEDGSVTAGSRNKWLLDGDDNHGFAYWVKEHADKLRALGVGRHHGEWWGSKIRRGYGLEKGDKRFSLFNTAKWGDNPARPKCCHVVPVLYHGPISEVAIEFCLDKLREIGSQAAPHFMQPEGIVIYHTAANWCFKKTIMKDDEWKGKES